MQAIAKANDAYLEYLSLHAYIDEFGSSPPYSGISEEIRHGGVEGLQRKRIVSDER